MRRSRPGHGAEPGIAGRSPIVDPVRGGIGPARLAVMRRFVGLLCGTALGFFAPAAGAQQVGTPAPEVKAGLTEAAWLRATRGTERRSTPMLASGVTFDLTGATLMLAGTLLYTSGNDKPCGGTTQSNPALPCSSTTDHVTGMALMASGIIALGLGLPLTFYGAAEVPRAEAGRVIGPQVPRVTVALGLRGAAFALHF
jgi:hypothetical protein